MSLVLRVAVVAVGCSLGACVAFSAEQVEGRDEKMAFGGPRGARASVKQLAGEFIVIVEMTPLSCFDSATNASVNRSKAEIYALTAFCRSSFGKSKLLTEDAGAIGGSGAVFKGVRIVESGLQDGKYRLRLLIPEDGIQPPPVKSRTPKPFDRSSPLFSGYGDHQATIEALHRALKAELAEVLDQGAASEMDKAAISEAVESLRVAGSGRFSAVRELIKRDYLLLDTTERPELLAGLAAVEEEWRNNVDTCLHSLATNK